MVAARRRRLLAQHQDRAARRLRAVLGAVELPGAEQRDQQLRPDRLHAEHASARRPAARRPSALTNPFPNGLVAAARQRARRARPASARRSATSIRTAPRRACSSTRPTSSASCPTRWRSTVSYIGARGDHLPLGGTVDTVVNINQLDPKYLALGAVGAEPDGPEPVLRQRQRRAARDARRR